MFRVGHLDVVLVALDYSLVLIQLTCCNALPLLVLQGFVLVALQRIHLQFEKLCLIEYTLADSVFATGLHVCLNHGEYE